MKTMEQSNWRQLFEPFYGKEYCVMITMDLEMLRDEQFQRNSFHFEEGWVRPTLELLKRLTSQGFPVRTKDYIVVHLTRPLESMAYGEFYFQAGRKLPGRLSMKFNRRRHADGVHVIQPTTLTPEEEYKLSVNPTAFLATLREQARTTQPDYQSLLTTLVLLNNQYERHRVNANSFFQSFLHQSPQPNHTRSYMATTADPMFFSNYQPEALCSFPMSTRQATPNNFYGGGVLKPRSGSEGLIPRFTTVNHENQMPGARQMSPVENDETRQSDASSSEGSQYIPVKALNDGIGPQDPPKPPALPVNNKMVSKVPTSKEMPTESYVDTSHGMSGRSDSFQDRRESTDSGSGRTSLKSDYVVNALSSLTLDSHSDESDIFPFATVNRRPSNEVHNGGANYSFTFNSPTWIGSPRHHPQSVNTWLQTCPSLPSSDVRLRALAHEDYTGTGQVFSDYAEAGSWTSHQQSDSHAGYQIVHPHYGPGFLSFDPPSLMCPSISGQPVMIPLTVEELNHLSDRHQHPMQKEC